MTETSVNTVIRKFKLSLVSWKVICPVLLLLLITVNDNSQNKVSNKIRMVGGTSYIHRID